MEIEGFDSCLAHLEPARQDRFLRTLQLGSEVDLRGTELSGELVERLVAAVRSGDGKRVEFGSADFTEAWFREDVAFEDVTFFETTFAEAKFDGHANFRKAVFRDHASFVKTRFGDKATFGEASFEDTTFERAEFAGGATFDRSVFDGGTFEYAQFGVTAWFDHALFKDDANFSGTRFTGRTSFCAVRFESEAQFFHEDAFLDDVWFDNAEFLGEADFSSLDFRGHAGFKEVNFAGGAKFENVRFRKRVWFEGVRFGGEAVFEGTRFEDEAGFDRADFEAAERFGPVTAEKMTFRHTTFHLRTVFEAKARELDCAEATFSEGVTLRLHSAVSLERAVFGKPSMVAAEPVASVSSLRGTDVADLVLSDVDLSNCRFAGAHHLDKLRLEGVCTFGSFRRRQALIEELVWREHRDGATNLKRIADLYRQLRKAQEDTKNLPGAADFYYGETEMRRHSPATPWSERVILHLYWLVAGYGLRALRALATLAVLIAVVSVGFWLGGFETTPAFGDALIYVAQSTVSLETKLTSLPKDLTAFGEVMRLVMRVLGPLLLGLALLAVRNRVKR